MLNMGHEYSSATVIGFVMDQDDFLMPFKTMTEEKFHVEDRFDQRTGKKLKPVKVVDEPSEEGYVVDGEVYECSYDVMDALSSLVGCDIRQHGNACTGEDFMVSVEPKYASALHEGSVKLAEVPKLMEECLRIRVDFKKRFGMDLGEPVITSLDSYG